MTELVVRPGEAAAASARSQEWLSAARKAKALSWLSLVWMSLEGGIAIAAGIAAGSIALIGFGIDSAIEGVASVVIIWRFTGARALSNAARNALRSSSPFSSSFLRPTWRSRRSRGW